MKKIFSVLWLLVCTLMVANAASYGIIVNGKRYFVGTKNPSPGDPSFEEYMALGVPLKSGDVLALYDADNKASWAVTLDKASAAGISISGNQYSCSKAGCYDFYIKLKYQQDQLYVGSGAAGCTDWGKDVDDPTPPDPDCQDGPYGLEINGTDIVNAPMFGEPDAQGRVQYKAACVELKANDIIKLANLSCDARWMVDVDPYGAYQNFSGGSSAGSLTCNVAGKYDFYIKLSADQGDLVYIGECTPKAVPVECEDVMMQGFYWDSYHVDKESAPATVIYGDTKWETLYKQSGEIGAYFDLIWLPPSAFSSGGVGYLPKQYSKQNSDWGNRTSLEKLINAFHNSGTKVIADIVVNHLDYKSSGCDFYENDFGEFGKFQPDYTWITKNDEIWGSGNAECKTPGPNAKDDDGYGPYDERNYNGARDLDHDGSEDVRKMVRAYEQWMIKEMKYDGFRYDYCKGFHGSHINDYNNTSKPYLSVMEYWSSLDAIMNCIKDADYNTMAFDFQTKYAAFNDAGKPGQGIVSGNYSGCKGSGMLGAGFAQYAVTFVDNHDTFERDDNEFGGKGNSMKPALKDKLMQANAFILGMPGVPCVFYPHWYKYKEDIKPMINARHMAGVHSQSQVKDEYCDDGGYQATIVGHHGYLILCLGNKAGQSFDGFQKVAFGNGYAMWVQVSGNQAPKLQVTPSNIFRDKEQGMTVEVKAVGGSCNKPTVYYTVDGTEPTTSSESFEASKTFVFKDSTVLKVMAACGNAFSQVQSYHYDYVEPQKEGIIVKFNAPEDWERVFIYAWDTKNEMITPGFPGQELFQQPDGWYQYQFEYGKDTVNFKFSMGRAGACSTDQQTVMDVCYEWDEQNGDAVKVACGEIVVPLNVVASPSSCKFADATKGIDVKVWAVSNEPAKIYYTLNGAEPTEQSQMAWDSVSFTLNQTTEVKAFAVCGKEKSPVKTFTYVYHEQKGAITIRFFNTSNWEKVYYYAWIPGATKKDKVTELLGAWPGTEIKTKDGDWYTYTFDAKYTQFSLIFDAGKDAAQTSDLTIVSDGCYEWRENLNDVVENVGCLVTGIEQVMIEPRNNGHKLMIDGQLYIQHNNHMFNIFGLQVK
ncbi:MAG: starch-binding protein [Bacteroidales bacterium]|nr:starch-binding protein [Candidatus Colicola caccequi]